MITIEQAFKIRRQIIDGLWVGYARPKYDHRPLEDISCYTLDYHGWRLWVASGFSNLRFMAGNKEIKIPFVCKLIIFFAADKAAQGAVTREYRIAKSKISKSLSELLK